MCIYIEIDAYVQSCLSSSGWFPQASGYVEAAPAPAPAPYVAPEPPVPLPVAPVRADERYVEDGGGGARCTLYSVKGRSHANGTVASSTSRSKRTRRKSNTRAVAGRDRTDVQAVGPALEPSLNRSATLRSSM